MKRRDLESHLRRHGCQPLCEGARHVIWANLTRDLRSPLPRHREIPAGAARAICRQLGVSPPAGRR